MDGDDQKPAGGPCQVRAFVAVDLPDGVKRLLGDIETHLRRKLTTSPGTRAAEASLKWVNPDSIHITLKFLGYVSADRIPAIEDALRRATRGMPAFRLAVEGLGVFPGFSRPRVIWVGVKGDLVRLAALQSQVETAVAKHGFPMEKRPFSPHLTLARVRETVGATDARLLGQVVKEFSGVPVESRAIPVEHVSLMRSDLSRQGARYTRLAHFSLSV